MCTPLAGSIRGKPSPSRSLARHSRGCSGPLLARRSQTVRSGPGVTACNMRYSVMGAMSFPKIISDVLLLPAFATHRPNGRASTPCLVCPVAWPIHDIESTEPGTAFRTAETKCPKLPPSGSTFHRDRTSPISTRKSPEVRGLRDSIRDFGELSGLRGGGRSRSRTRLHSQIPC